ncbi:MAG: PTS sugar transporter subunit IIA [Polyangiaceae bacterium]
MNLENASSFLVLSLVLLVGIGFGGLAKRFRLPSVTGQIVAGVLIGPAVLGVVSPHNAHRLEPVIDFALGLMAVDVGSHLSLRRLRPAMRRLGLLILFEATLTPILVFGLVRLFSNVSWYMAALLAAVAISTAPATILALVKEARAKGVFVKTLVAAVALNNLVCILVFEQAHAMAATAATGHDRGFLALASAPLLQLVKSALLACLVGGALILATRNVVRQDRLTAASMLAITTAIGVAEYFHVSVLLSCLFIGVMLENVTPDKDEVGPGVFANFEYAIYAVFFTVAGTELQFRYLAVAGMITLMVFAGRASGKVAAGTIAMTLAQATRPIQRYLGVALLPQAGLAVGLMLLVTDNPVFAATPALRAERDTFLAVVLGVVLLNELVGPILTRVAVERSGEVGRDRARVLDFLREEHILCDQKAGTLEEAIELLVGHLTATHRVPLDAESLYEQVMEREAEASTCLGNGLALPHLVIEDGREITGVMGIFPEGIEAATPDDQLVHCVVLFVTPASEHNHHLAVLAAFARVIGQDRNISQLLYKSHSPAHAHDVLHAHEQSEWFNSYLEEL